MARSRVQRDRVSAQYGASNFPRTVSPNCVDFTRSPYAQRGHDAASTVPSLRSVHPPSPHEVGRRRRREEGVYTKALTHAHRIVRAHIRAEEARWRSICFLSPSLPPSGAVPGAPPATHATTHRHAASANHQQQIALAGVTLAAAAASARHQYVLLALALVLICTGWRATLTRFSALGQPSTPASVTLAVTAASA